MEQQTPVPPTQIKDEVAQGEKRAIFQSLIWGGGGGGGGSRFSIYFVQDYTLVAVVIRFRRGGAIYLFTYR